jgi:hypothetical protein
MNLSPNSLQQVRNTKVLKDVCFANLLREINGLNSQETQESYHKVFISWSRSKSHDIAVELSKWLPYIIQSIKPFISAGNIRKGMRWSDILAQELHETQYGIICVTRQNVLSPWLNFEAGALSKHIGQSYVAPILFEVDPSRLQGPLSQFQATVFDEKDKNGDEIFALVSSINNSLPIQRQVSSEVLKGTFDKWWPDLQKGLRCVLDKETNETETTFDWLLSATDLKSAEKSPCWESVLVVSNDPEKSWISFQSVVQSNLENKVKYDFIVPEDKVCDFVRMIEHVKTWLKNSSENNNANEIKSENNNANEIKLELYHLTKDEFKRQAVTHYRILTHKGNKSREAYFEVPVDPGDYWVKAKPEASEGFFNRFDRMKNPANCDLKLPQ